MIIVIIIILDYLWAVSGLKKQQKHSAFPYINWEFSNGHGHRPGAIQDELWGSAVCSLVTLTSDSLLWVNIPSGKRLHNYGTSQFLMAISTINGHCQ